MIVKFTRLREEEGFCRPERQHAGDAGLDLTITRYVQVFAGQNAHLPTNIAMEIPAGHFGLILPRSSTLWRKGLHVSPGVIDSGYRGEVMVVVRNITDRSTQVEEGQRVAQLFILPVAKVEFDLVSNLTEGDRGDRGFGSSGDMIIWTILPLLGALGAV